VVVVRVDECAVDVQDRCGWRHIDFGTKLI
jgi:hypothetical protein